MSDRPRCYIRVTVAEDGKTMKRELCIDGEVQCEISPVEIIEAVMQFTSSLRYDVPKLRG